MQRGALGSMHHQHSTFRVASGKDLQGRVRDRAQRDLSFTQTDAWHPAEILSRTPHEIDERAFSSSRGGRLSCRGSDPQFRARSPTADDRAQRCRASPILGGSKTDAQRLVDRFDPRRGAKRAAAPVRAHRAGRWWIPGTFNISASPRRASLSRRARGARIFERIRTLDRSGCWRSDLPFLKRFFSRVEQCLLGYLR